MIDVKFYRTDKIVVMDILKCDELDYTYLVKLDTKYNKNFIYKNDYKDIIITHSKSEFSCDLYKNVILIAYDCNESNCTCFKYNSIEEAETYKNLFERAIAKLNIEIYDNKGEVF